jgi:hypothetical protein
VRIDERRFTLATCMFNLILQRPGLRADSMGGSMFRLFSTRSFWRWFILGVLFLGAALFMTIPAMHVDLSNHPMILTAAYTQMPGRPNAVFRFRETDDGSDIEISIEPDGQAAPSPRIFFLSYVKSCFGPMRGANIALDVEKVTPKPVFDTQTFDSEYKIAVPAGVDQEASITCHLDVRPLRATYSDRRVAFARDADTSAQLPAGPWHQTSNDVYVFEQRNARDLKVEHASDASGNSMHIDNSFIVSGGSDFNPVTMDWTDVPAERLHEFVYFIAAALITLALTCLVEAARPWIGKEQTSTDQDCNR